LSFGRAFFIMPKLKESKGKNKGGRPTKYKAEHCNALVRFFNINPHFSKDITITKSDGTQIDKSEETASDMPFFIDFCESIGIDYSTFENWIDKKSPYFKKEFFRAYKKALQYREKVLITNGLLGLYSPAFAIFTAKNILGWRDKSEVEHSGDVTHNMFFSSIEAKSKGIDDNGKEKG